LSQFGDPSELFLQDLPYRARCRRWTGFWLTLGDLSELTGPQWQSSLVRSPGYEAVHLAPTVPRSVNMRLTCRGMKAMSLNIFSAAVAFSLFLLYALLDTVLQVAVSHSFIDTLFDCFVNI
jgi:hypothetical protein